MEVMGETGNMQVLHGESVNDDSRKWNCSYTPAIREKMFTPLIIQHIAVNRREGGEAVIV